MGRIFQQHGINTLASAVYADCALFEKGEECKFCRMGDGRDFGAMVMKQNRDLVETVQEALAFNPNYEVCLNGGTLYKPGRGFEIIIPRVKAIRDAVPGARMAVEEVPPEQNSYLDALLEAGADVVLMNWEVFDERLRQQYCPGKSKLVTRERMQESLEYAVEIFGRGNVTSCLIAGLEPRESTMEGARFLSGLGVIPSILPYRPITGKISPEIRLNPDDLLEISRRTAAYIREAGLRPLDQTGCVGCTGCSLEGNIKSHN